VKTDPDVRQDHSSGVERYRVAKAKAIVAGRKRVADDMEYMKPPTVVAKRAKKYSALEEPDMHFMPDSVFAARVDLGNGKKPQELGRPVVGFKRMDGTTVVGIVFRAETYQPPDGCFRIKAGEEFSTEKHAELANSHEECFQGEGQAAMMTSIQQQDFINNARNKQGDIIEANDFYNDKGVYGSLSAAIAELRPKPESVQPRGASGSVAGSSTSTPASTVLNKRAFQESDLLHDELEDDGWGGVSRVKVGTLEQTPAAQSGGQVLQQNRVAKKPKIAAAESPVGASSGASGPFRQPAAAPEKARKVALAQPAEGEGIDLRDSLAFVITEQETMDAMTGFNNRVRQAAEKGVDMLETLLDEDVLKKPNPTPFNAADAKIQTQLRILEGKSDPCVQVGAQSLAALSVKLQHGFALLAALKGEKTEKSDEASSRKKKKCGAATTALANCDYKAIEAACLACGDAQVEFCMYPWFRCYELKCFDVAKNSDLNAAKALSVTYRDGSSITLACFLDKGVESVEIEDLQKDGFKQVFSESVKRGAPEEYILHLTDTATKADFPEDEGSDFQVLWDLMHVEEAGQTAVKHALAKARGAIAGLLFELRYREKGRSIRAKAAEWSNKFVAGSQLVAKLTRIAELARNLVLNDAAVLAEWAPVGASFQGLLVEAAGNSYFGNTNVML
jgi:hypothetical protein